MNRLRTEFHRLYGVGMPAGAEAKGDDRVETIDGQGRVRAGLIELARPADWGALAAVWQGVQAELEQPAPAIAVSGVDGLQLWFSFAKPVAAARVHAWLDRLCRRFLPGLPVRRLRLWPSAGDDHPPTPLAMPGRSTAADRWSAFVAPDLAPVFADSPWLEMPPGDEGQARLLAGLRSLDPAVLGPGETFPASSAPTAADPDFDADPTAAPTPAVGRAATEPAAFLLAVMNDPSAPLALRVDAAKALLLDLPPPRRPA